MAMTKIKQIRLIDLIDNTTMFSEMENWSNNLLSYGVYLDYITSIAISATPGLKFYIGSDNPKDEENQPCVEIGPTGLLQFDIPNKNITQVRLNKKNFDEIMTHEGAFGVIDVIGIAEQEVEV